MARLTDRTVRMPNPLVVRENTIIFTSFGSATEAPDNVVTPLVNLNVLLGLKY